MLKQFRHRVGDRGSWVLAEAIATATPRRLGDCLAGSALRSREALKIGPSRVAREVQVSDRGVDLENCAMTIHANPAEGWKP